MELQIVGPAPPLQSRERTRFDHLEFLTPYWMTLTAVSVISGLGVTILNGQNILYELPEELDNLHSVKNIFPKKKLKSDENYKNYQKNLCLYF